MASQVLGVAGAVIGGVFGVPQLGYMVGSALGAMLFPPPGQDGPRIGDLAVQKSTYGTMIPIVWGRYRLAGNVIWSTQLIEHAHEQDSGSGGGGSTSYTYTCSFAVLVCKGVHGIRRIWADSKLVYDATDAINPVRFKATSYAIYTGTEDQLADPTIEADKGVGYVPGYRGLVYMVFTDLELAKFGNRIPNFSFETSDVTVVDTTDTISFNVIGDALEGATSEGGAFPYQLLYVPSTDRLWQFTNVVNSIYRQFPTGSFAILDRETMTVDSYTNGELDYCDTATYTLATTPPSNQAAYDFATTDSDGLRNRGIIIPVGATGVWAGRDNQIGTMVGGIWSYVTKVADDRMYDYIDGTYYVFDGSAWGELDWEMLGDDYVDLYYKQTRYCALTDRVFAIDMDNSAIRVFDATTGAVILTKLYASGYLGGDLISFAMDETTGDLIVGGCGAGNDVLARIDGITLEVTTELSQGYERSLGVAVAADGRIYYSTSRKTEGTNLWLIRVVDAEMTSYTNLLSLPESADIRGPCYDPSRNLMTFTGWTFGEGVYSTAVYVIDCSTDTVVYETSIPSSRYALLYYDAENDLFWGVNDNHTLTAYDPETFSQIRQSEPIEGIDEFSSLNIDSNIVVTGHNAYAVNGNTNTEIARYRWGTPQVGDKVSLWQIVSDITALTPLPINQINVAQLTDSVVGYCITNSTSARSAIEPLMQAYFFDAVESNDKVKFVKRGYAPVVTVPVSMSVPNGK